MVPLKSFLVYVVGNQLLFFFESFCKRESFFKEIRHVNLTSFVEILREMLPLKLYSKYPLSTGREITVFKCT